MIIPSIKKGLRATVAKRALNTFQLEVICICCRRRGLLWFDRDHLFTAHACPCCGQLKLKSPVWLKNKKRNSFIIFK